ncbi:MAG: hypothetical protein HN732_02455 [Rhodospirillaceae bacterium]|jgi:uncharacterized membrane protein (GlpM family)|nr:hypothetical protein [Rhodospirillaceae bacterium]MBT5195691.1 hypothetical protein [Rhodospirillaceae bacterium]MBT5895288.1 hypothetical protein [Rhodospirillaceae bacterium]MBT7756159.1 hypothetical protein [Rhodospirillaceae bacterium]
METIPETSLLVKAVWSIVVVMGLTLIAERVGTRIAGLLSGAPLTAVLVYFFVGKDLGIDYVVDSVPYSIAAFTGTLCFVLAYYWSSARMQRFSAVGGALTAIAAFLAVAAILSTINFTLPGATALTGAMIVLSIWLVRNIEFIKVARPVRLTFRQLLLRGGAAALLITTVISLAETVGPRWTGLLVGFPATLLPTYLIIHFTYGRASTHAMIRNFPTGVGSIIIYILLVPFTFPAWGPYGGTAACLAASSAYLGAIMLLGRIRSVAASRSRPEPYPPPDQP